jgi:hypothetical protein
MTSRSTEMARRMAGIELHLAGVDDRFDAINRWLLDAPTASARAHPTVASASRHVADFLDGVERSAASPGAEETSVDSPGGPEGGAITSLATWVNWVAMAFDLSERWPSCWYRHEGLVFEMHSLRRWHIALGAQLASDPTSATRWSEALHRVAAQSARHIAQRCLSTHRDAPALDPVRVDAGLHSESDHMVSRRDPRER